MTSTQKRRDVKPSWGHNLPSEVQVNVRKSQARNAPTCNSNATKCRHILHLVTKKRKYLLALEAMAVDDVGLYIAK